VGKDLIPSRLTTVESEKHVDLLLLEDEENEDAHYILLHDRAKFEGRHGVIRAQWKNFQG
jgi:hypothetical protein